MRKLIIILLSIITFNSCDDILEVPDISNDTVNLIAPANGSIVQGNATTFNWQSVQDADEYNLQVATPNFNNASRILIDSTVSSTSFTGELLPNEYEWRIKALNSGFETLYSSNSFTVQESEGLAGNTLILESPTDNFATNNTNVTVSWNAIQDASEYRIQVLDANDEIILDEVITETTIVLTFTEGSFRWRIRAQNTSENTRFSTRSIVIDLTNPNVPTPVTPTTNTTINNTNDIEFSWSREEIPGSNEFDTVFIYTDMSLQNLVTSGTSNNRNFITNLESDTYFWVVQAFDDAGNESTASVTNSFTVN